MRLWHYKLIKFLPNLQLMAQWRELNSIFKNKPKHILINYIYDYSKDYLDTYTNLVLKEMNRRKINIKSMVNCKQYFGDKLYCRKYFKEHDSQYLTICYYNLKEKHLRGQKGFSAEVWNKLENYYKQIVSR